MTGFILFVLPALDLGSLRLLNILKSGLDIDFRVCYSNSNEDDYGTSIKNLKAQASTIFPLEVSVALLRGFFFLDRVRRCPEEQCVRNNVTSFL